MGRTIREQTAATMKNIETILTAVGSSLDQVAKVSVFLRSVGDFAAFNESYSEFFPNGFPARTTVQAADMVPEEALLEIDCIAELS